VTRYVPLVLRQCCWCHAIWDGGKWVKADGLPLFGRAKHGVCDGCMRKLIGEYREIKAVEAG